jgi:glycerophosphoryl diester phosphodiesterase
MAHVAISAHWGGSYHPLDTYETYHRAAGSGADYVEIDIRRTRDGVLVAHHDEHCGQPGRGVGPGRGVADLRYDEMCELLGYPVPRLTEVMDLLAGRVAGHLDLKATGYEVQAVELALEAFGPSRFVVTTLEDLSVARIHGKFPGVLTALSLGRELGVLPTPGRIATRLSEVFPVRRLRACGAHWAALDYRLAHAGVLGRCAAQGIGTMLWTVDRDRPLTRFLADPRVSVVITNRPRRALALRQALGG